MKTLRIVTDSSMDYPRGWDEEFEINILPINIQLGEKSYRQGIDINLEQFYKLVREKKLIPKTSLPSTGQIIDFYRRIARKGDDILSLHVASKMSGTFNAVQLAAKEIVSEFNVIPFDSGNGSAGLAYMAKEARLLDRAGKSVKDIVDRLEGIRKKITIVMTLDTLEFARRSGRVNLFQERISSILQIKPIIMLKDGMLEIADRVRTRKRSIDRVLDLVKQKVGEKVVNIAIVHAEDYPSAMDLLNLVKEKFSVKEVILTDLSISVAANLGPGTIGVVAYPADEDAV